MTEQEFERLKRRFGADVSLWPAPFRQEGQRFLVGEDEASENDAVDRLVLDASQAQTDEIALTRKVLAEINNERQPVNWFLEYRRTWAMPTAAASGFAALLLVAAVAGYTMAERLEATDDSLMALALGEGGLGNGEVGGGLFDEPGGEEQL